MISQKIGGQAGMIASIMLQKNSTHSFKEGRTHSMTTEEILKVMTGNTGGILSSTPRSDPKGNKKNILNEKLQALNSYMEETARQNKDYFVLEGNNKYGLNLSSISSYLKARTLEKMIEQQFTQHHLRIYRLLTKCGALDMKNIMEVCLIPPKDCNTYLNQLINEGYVDTQMVNMKGQNVLFYCASFTHNVDLVAMKCYKMVRNLKYFLKAELEKIKNIESKLRQEEYITKVYGTISEIDETIVILKYF